MVRVSGKRARPRGANMARKANRKSQAKKVTKRVGKKSKRTAANKTKTKKVAKKVHRAKTVEAGKSKKKLAAEAAIRIDNMAYGLGYLIP